jgi:hypothetical protein
MKVFYAAKIAPNNYELNIFLLVGGEAAESDVETLL